MADYVVGVDANYPVGARKVIPKIRAMTAKPIPVRDRYPFSTQTTRFGNQVWADAGAIRW